MTSNFLDNTCTKIQNMAFKTSQMDQIALEYWYYGFLGRLRVDGRGFLHQTPILKNCSPEQKSSCCTCAEACHSPLIFCSSRRCFSTSGDNTSICRSLHILRKPNSIRDWSKSIGGGGWVMRFWALCKEWVVQFSATLRGWVTLFYLHR